MGTVITLSLGNVEIDWGKNFGHTNHSRLFLPHNLHEYKVKYHDEDNEGKYIEVKKKVLMAPLREILPRLQLLGVTLASAEKIYNETADYISYRKALPFKDILESAKKAEIEKLPLTYKDADFDPGEYVSTEILQQLDLLKKMKTYPEKPNKNDVGELLENFHPWAILRLFAENDKNLDISVIWDFNDHMEAGWSELEELTAPLPKKNKFIIVTEGNSDSLIIKKSINLLRPEIADFFSFIDMEEGYPFTGVGNLHNFCQGLVKIGVANNILVIYDNDTEGKAKFNETRKLRFPDNMRIMQLPDLEKFKNFETSGPNGKHKDNINGRAVAIECFLDLNWSTKTNPYIRWTSYNNKIHEYQGELANKTDYTKLFMKLTKKESKYDFSKLSILIDKIEKECVEIGEKTVSENV